MKKYWILFGTLTIFFFMFKPLCAQTRDSTTSKKHFKNTIRFNISAPLIFGGRNLILGYERIVGKNQSFSINAGSFGLPNFISSDSLNASTTRHDKGFAVSADYRFYLAKENKYPAPRGVYVGPYYAYNHLSREDNWVFNNSKFKGTADAVFDIYIHTIGVELGYQFVFWDRLTVDMVVIGPGVANYKLRATINNDLKPEQQQAILTSMAQSIKEQVPGASNFLNQSDFERTGTTSSWDLGYRYIVHVGFRF